MELKRYVEKFLALRESGYQNSSSGQSSKEPPVYFDSQGLAELFPLEFLSKPDQANKIKDEFQILADRYAEIVDGEEEEDHYPHDQIDDATFDQLIVIFLTELGKLVPVKYHEFMRESILVGLLISEIVNRASDDYTGKRASSGSSG